MTPGCLSRRALLTATLSTAAATALGRTPTGGKLALKVPWPLDTLDPHRIDDAAAALFAPAIADALFALDGHGAPYPTLAAALPERTERGAKVVLRPGLRTGRGRPLDSRDVLFTVARSRHLGGVGVLAGLPKAIRDRADPLAAWFPGADPSEVARALASPIAALVPRGFDPRSPDGTGAFTARIVHGTLRLERNVHAARGASFLDAITVTRASDLADALRSFEVGDVDVGWLGTGLHRPRAGAIRFDAGSVGWIVLRTGAQAGRWSAPGIAQRLVDAVPTERLAHLGLGPRHRGGGGARWNGPRSNLLVPEDAAHLVEIGRVLAAVFTRPSHEVRFAPRPRREFERAVSRGQFSLALDVVRRTGPPGRHTLLALTTAANRRAALRLPRLPTYDPTTVTRTLPLGVVGDLRVAGAHAPGLELRGWDLGGASR